MENKERLRRDKVDVIHKIGGALLIPLALAIVGYFGNRYLQTRQELETRTRLYSELMSKREEAESALRKDMLRTIIDSFLQSKTTSLEAKVLNLELLTFNFHESLYLAPLFYHLEREINSPDSVYPDKGYGKEYKMRLKRVAREVIRKQMLILEGHGAKLDGSIGIGEIAEYLPQLPKDIIFPAALKDKIHYEIDHDNSKRNRIVFKGIMSKDEFDTLSALSTDKVFQKTVRLLFKKSLSLHHIAKPLDYWPADIEIPDALEKKIRYDDNAHLLIFKGMMSAEEKATLLQLSSDDAFQKAITALFDASQDLPQREKDRTYQIRVSQEKTLTVDQITRTFTVTVLEVNLKTEEIKVRLDVKPPVSATNGIPGSGSPKSGRARPPSLLTAEFWVGFYDFPMVDNIRLPNDQRCAVVLNKFEEPMTEYTLVCFPGSRASLKEKPYYEEVLRRVLQPHDEANQSNGK